MTSDLVLQALLAAVWKRKPGPGVMVHSDQGSQFTSDDWQSFLKAHQHSDSGSGCLMLEPMHFHQDSLGGDCWRRRINVQTRRQTRADFN